VSLTKDHNITTGKVYKTVIDKERQGAYLGKTVQVSWIKPISHLSVFKCTCRPTPRKSCS